MTKPSDNESPILDAVDFDVVFTVYTDQPVKAFILAQHLDHLKALVESGPQGALLAIVVIDLIILRPQDDPRSRDMKK